MPLPPGSLESDRGFCLYCASTPPRSTHHVQLPPSPTALLPSFVLRLRDATAGCKFTQRGFSITLSFGEREEKNPTGISLSCNQMHLDQYCNVSEALDGAWPRPPHLLSPSIPIRADELPKPELSWRIEMHRREVEWIPSN